MSLNDICRYEQVPETVPDGIHIGVITLSVEQISVGVMSCLITFIPALLIVFCFRKARRRVLRPNR